MRKIVILVVLLSFIGVHAYAGENQDKRKRKAEQQQEKYRQQQEAIAKVRLRDLNTEERLYKEIQAHEQMLNQLRRKLCFLHEENTRKYGQQYVPGDQLEYIARYRNLPVNSY
jgi:hypothetical protein